jgi:hypothetical protein
MKTVLIKIDGAEHEFLFPEDVTIEQIAEAVDGIGGRPNDRG